jgi:hypothetical protein
MATIATHFKANLSNIMPVDATAGSAYRWHFVDFFDKVLIAQNSVQPHYWPGTGDSRPLPGLSDDSAWAGIEVIGGHPVLWRDQTLLVGAVNDFSTWVPISASASVARSAIKTSFSQPDPGGETGWIGLEDPDDLFAVGQFARIDINADVPDSAQFNFYTVTEVSNQAGSQATHAEWAVTIEEAKKQVLAVQELVDFSVGGFLAVNGAVTDLQVTGARETAAFSAQLTQSTVVPAINSTTKFYFNTPSDLVVGDVLSISSIEGAQFRDLYQITVIDGVEVTAKRLGLGTNQKDSGTFTTSSPQYYATLTPWIEVENMGDSNVIVPSEAELGGTSAVKLRNLGYTGSADPGELIPSGSILDSMLANTAAEIINAGSDINGEIFAVTSIGEYGFILKEQSIQSMQAINAPGIPYAIRLEVPGIGPISRNAWCQMHVENEVQGLFFVGKNDLFIYSGGQSVVPIGRQHSQQFFDELDRSRVEEITCQQYPHLRQIWVAYPQLQSVVKRVLIYNYEDNSITIDDYPATLGGLSALGLVDWEIAPTWNDLESTQIWVTETLRWYEYSEDGEKQHTLIGVQADTPNAALGEDTSATIPRLLLHGRVFYRLSSDDCRADDEGGYTCLAETHDYDFGSPAHFKYTDHVELAIDTDGVDRGVTSLLYVQLGGRSNLDDEIKWTSPVAIDVRGRRNWTTKVGLRMSGRYIRMRAYSVDPQVQWKISRFTIVGRLGGTY